MSRPPDTRPAPAITTPEPGAPTTRALRVVGYVRVSTARQGESGYGLDAQRATLERYCEANGHELLTITTDIVSGAKTEAMYGREVAIAAVEAGVADALLVRSLDRATRDQEDAARLFKRAERGGWRLMDTDKADSGDPSQRLLADIRLAVAAEERRKISERTREGLAAAKARGVRLGRPSSVPPEVAERIVAMRREGKSAVAIAQRLTNEGVPTPGGSEIWAHSTVRRVYLNAERAEAKREAVA